MAHPFSGLPTSRPPALWVPRELYKRTKDNESKAESKATSVCHCAVNLHRGLDRRIYPHRRHDRAQAPRSLAYFRCFPKAFALR